MKSIDQITAAINDTIAARKEQLPAIQAERSHRLCIAARRSHIKVKGAV